MNGKDKCRILKDIRRQIAQENEIEWVVSECRHKGTCKGTCPKCESEVRQLEQALENRRRLGKVVAVAGISAACLTGLTACTMEDVVDFGTELVQEIAGSTGARGGTGSGRDTIKPAEKETEKATEPETYELDGDVWIPDDLSGYMPYEDYSNEPQEDLIIELDGEVPADYLNTVYSN